MAVNFEDDKCHFILYKLATLFTSMESLSPPLFKRGISPHLRFALLSFLAITIMIVDVKYPIFKSARSYISNTLQPLQRIVLIPRDMFLNMLDELTSKQNLQKDNANLHSLNLQLRADALRTAALIEENDKLRALLSLKQKLPLSSTPVEVLYDLRAFNRRKIMIDRGGLAHIQMGAPVVTKLGLVGQVTHVFPLQSEVTLITDREMAIPVQNVRTGTRTVIYGLSRNELLRIPFLLASADIQVGDEFVTSGLDEVYPAGLPVARIDQVNKQSDAAFVSIHAVPLARVDAFIQALVLHKVPPAPPKSATPSVTPSVISSPRTSSTESLLIRRRGILNSPNH